MGDLLLLEVATRLTTCVRDVDTVARFGGDEFVVVLSPLDSDRAEAKKMARNVAEKIRLCVAKPYTLVVAQDAQAGTTVEHHCSASIGVVVFDSANASHADAMKWADAAMYKAKEAGRNTIHLME